MALDYDKLKQNQEENTTSSLASYSDLFTCLSMVFLFMFVVASLRTGVGAITNHIEKSKMARENEDLKNQLKAYNALKDKAVQEQAQDEQKMYDELINKLSLLQDQAKDEKESLRRQANENEMKEVALNKYQQMIRNMINSQMIAKSKLNIREEVIENKKEIIKDQSQVIVQNTEVIQEQNENINELETTVDVQKEQIQKTQKMTEALRKKIKEKQELIAKNNNEMEQVSKELEKKMKDLASAQKKNAITKKNMLAQMDKIKKEKEQELNKLEAMNSEAKSKIANMNADVQMAKSKIKELSGEVEKASQEKETMGRKIASISGELDKAREELNARKKLAQKISENLAKNGVKAEVDKNTGDVIISFGEDYFEAGSHALNGNMKEVVKKFMPAYSKSLFENKDIASKIDSVEIIGFASPTYAGKYVDPTSLDPSAKKAAKFNLDLSYKRAKSIFEYTFDKEKMSFDNQEKMLPLVKVSGRSFFSEGDKKEGVYNGMSQAEFCKKHDCKKSQRVIIKFDISKK